MRRQRVSTSASVKVSKEESVGFEQYHYKNNVKKNKEFRFFLKLARNTIYADFFENAVYNKFPLHMSYRNGTLIYNSSKRTFIDVERNLECYENIKKFLARHSGLCEKVKKAKIVNKEITWKSLTKARKKIIIEEFVDKILSSYNKREDSSESEFSEDIEAEQLVDNNYGFLVRQLILGLKSGSIETKNITLEDGKISEIYGVRYSKSRKEFIFTKKVKILPPQFNPALPSYNECERKKSNKNLKIFVMKKVSAASYPVKKKAPSS